MSKEQVEHSAATHCYPLHGFVVMLEKGCWLADTDGDPGRTLQKKNAQLFSERADAVRALHFARGYRRFLNAEIIEVLTDNNLLIPATHRDKVPIAANTRSTTCH
jgi:hypothetical protein